MKGRLETALKRENNIKNILAELPKYVEDYYINSSNTLQVKTCEDYIKVIRRFLRFMNENRESFKLNKIRDTDISEFINMTKNKIDKNGEIVETTVANKRLIYYGLKSFFSYLKKSGKIRKNPMDCINKPAGKDTVKRPNITWENERDMLKLAQTGFGSKEAILQNKDWRKRDRLILMFFMYTGIRRTALSEINVDDIDFENKIISVVDKRNKKHEYIINEYLEEAILDWLHKRKELLGNVMLCLYQKERKDWQVRQ